MFTGIIETTAAVLEKTPTGLTLARPTSFIDITMGCSITVNGACLSVVRFDDASMSFDIVPETWDKTNLGDLHTGDKVNLERALASNGRFEGHIVQGHIEGTGTVVSFDKPTDSPWATLVIAVSDDLAKYIVYKGSIAINGVSLTVAAKEGNNVHIALIPHTLEVTNLGNLHAGDRVNMETDVLARYMESFLASRS